MEHLLIDGNNLAIRASFANSELKNSSGIPTGVHYGFLQSIATLRTLYPSYQFLVVWDCRSKRRMAETEEGVKNGVIPELYKANRKKEEQPQPLKDFHEQAPFLKRGIGTTGIPQICIEGFEADDVIASYCNMLKNGNKITVVTTDQDFYQLLDDNIDVYNGFNNKLITKASFIEENQIQPIQHVDVGALMGDDGDNIFGVPSVGDKTALELIKQHGTWQKTLEYYKEQYKAIREQFPDLDEENFKTIQAITTKSGKAKYPEIRYGMPFSGLVLASENKKIKAITKSTLLLLMFEERVKLAYSLKKMDDNIPDLPQIQNENPEPLKLQQYMDYYEIKAIVPSQIINHVANS